MTHASAPATSHHHGSARSDTVGQVLSAVCAVHCAATPLVIALAPAFASVLGGAHPLLFAAVLGVAAWAFVPAFRCHRKWSVVVLAALGVGLLGLAAFALHDDLVADTAVSLVGAATMMVAHWQNRVALRAAHRH